MKAAAALSILAALAGAPALAGDAAKGESLYGRCASCHAIATPAGETLRRGGPVGPNLWGVIGRRAGALAGFRYGDDLAAAGAAGLVWSEESLAAYIADPRKFLSEFLGGRARSRMAYKLRAGGEDVAAYLATFGPGG